MSNDNTKNLLEEYKELGLQFRHYISEINSTDRLLLPPLVIGLLVLSSKVERFLGVEIQNPMAAYRVIWCGCLFMALIWVFKVSRLAQVLRVTSETLRENETKLGLQGYTKIAEIDVRMETHLPESKLLRHHVLRLFCFYAYLSFLLIVALKLLLNPDEIYPQLKFLSSYETPILYLACIAAGYLTVWIWSFHFNFERSFSSSWNAPAAIQFIAKLIFRYIPVGILTLIIPFLFMFSYLEDKQLEPDPNANLISGLEYFATGNYDQAIGNFSQVIALYPNNASAYFNRGSAYYKKHEFAHAIVDFDKAIDLDPQNRRARDLRNEAQRELENLHKQ